MADTPDQVFQSVVAWINRIRDDCAELERLAVGNRRVLILSREIDVDAVNAINALERLRRHVIPT